MKTRFFYVVALLTITTFSACKKDNPQKENSCKISSVHRNDGTVYNFTRDAQGRVAVLTYNNKTVTYTYTASGYKQELRENNTLKQIMIFDLNAQGWLVKRTEQNFDDDGNIVTTAQVIFEYNASGQIIKRSNNSGSAITYEWSDGNMVNITNIATYSYDDKPVQDGDALGVIELIAYGRTVTKNKNLLKLVTSGVSTSNYSYEFDDKDRITKFTISGAGNPTIYEIMYQCP